MTWHYRPQDISIENLSTQEALNLFVQRMKEERDSMIELEKSINPATATARIASIATGITPPAVTNVTNITNTVSATVQVASVVQGSQTITFSPAQALANYRMLICEMTLTDRTIADLKSEVSNQTVNTFDIVAPEAGTLFFSPAPRA